MKREFKIGDKVTHRSHGAGKIIYFTGDPSSAVVHFDKEPERWGNDLEVSIACLKREDTK